MSQQAEHARRRAQLSAERATLSAAQQARLARRLHSLLVTDLIYRINQTWQLHLPLRSFFTRPTIAGLALLIEETLLEALEQQEI